MARAHFVSKSRKPIYTNGKYVKYKSKKGKNKGKMLERLDVTQPENKKDKILINVGESYYWWQFKGSNKTYSKERPKQSQLTRSSYLSALYNIQDRISEARGNVSSPEDLESIVDDIKSELENLKDEVENSLQNMPEHLQESSSSGQMLQERIDSLDNAISEIEGIDCNDYEEKDEDELKTEYQSERTEDMTDEDFEDLINQEKQRLLDEWLEEKCEELSNISLE